VRQSTVGLQLNNRQPQTLERLNALTIQTKGRRTNVLVVCLHLLHLEKELSSGATPANAN
jgi:hypothetical protein